jgi:hypothetical protein
MIDRHMFSAPFIASAASSLAGHVPMEELPEATVRDADAFLGPAGD